MSAPANPLRGEATLIVNGQPHLLRPSFNALVAAEEELGPLFALVERAGSGQLRLAEMVALFWHCLPDPAAVPRDAVGEAVLFFDPAMAEGFDYRCKQAGQLASKMRFLAAPWIGMMESGAWLRNAQHANGCAKRLAQKVEKLSHIELLFPVQSNAVFLKAPDAILDKLRERGWRFYTFIGGGARFMFAWDTDPEVVDELANDIYAAALG